MEEEIKKAPETAFEKINRVIHQMDSDIANVKSIYDSMRTKQKILKKTMMKLETKLAKKQKKSNTLRKPCGFAKPSPVTKEMCEFLNISEGSLASRTQVTKKLIEYIKEKKLQGEVNKREIRPDEVLYKLFGEEARNQVITYFTMQKFVNHHFVKEPTVP